VSRLEEVRKRLAATFRRRLGDRILEIETATAGLCGADTGSAVDRIRHVAHQLQGSGASFGFPEVSDAAAAVSRADDRSLPTAVETLLAVLRSARES
jgi:HPt (histidine-containing phosphotransfer) domain-containing protein